VRPARCMRTACFLGEFDPDARWEPWDPRGVARTASRGAKAVRGSRLRDPVGKGRLAVSAAAAAFDGGCVRREMPPLPGGQSEYSVRTRPNFSCQVEIQPLNSRRRGTGGAVSLRQHVLGCSGGPGSGPSLAITPTKTLWFGTLGAATYGTAQT